MLSNLLFASLAASAAALPNTSSPKSRQFTTPRNNFVTRLGAVKPEILTALNYTLSKYTDGVYLKTYHALTEPKAKRGTPNRLFDQCDINNDVLYYGDIKIRNQTFTIDFDTGSADLFVPGPDCGSLQGCPDSAKYDEGGQDLDNTTSVTYGSGAITGENYLDTVHIGNLSARHVNVISLSDAQGFSTSASDGLMGLAFSTIAKSKQPTFIEKLIAENKISEKVFCFYLGRCSDNTGKNSELYIGGKDKKKYKRKLTTVPVKSQDYWRVNIDGVRSKGGPSVEIDVPGDAAIDTGTTALMLSSVYAMPLNLAMGGIAVPLGGSGSSQTVAYAVPCQTNQTISLKFAGKHFAINAKDLFIGTVDLQFAELLGNKQLLKQVQGTGKTPNSTYCLSSILQADLGPAMHPPVANFNIIGDTFLKNWYSCYSYDAADGEPAVLFAKSI